MKTEIFVYEFLNVIRLNLINNNRSGYNSQSKAEVNFAAVNRLNRSVVVNQQIAFVIGQLTELCQLKLKFNSAVEFV